MRFINRSLSHRGSRRKLRAGRARGNWSVEMTVLIAIALGVFAAVLYRALN